MSLTASVGQRRLRSRLPTPARGGVAVATCAERGSSEICDGREVEHPWHARSTLRPCDEHGIVMKLRVKFYFATVRASAATSSLLDRGFDVVEKAAGCYLEKNGVKVPFARANGMFVLLARRRVQNSVTGEEVDGDTTAAAGAELQKLGPCVKSRQERRLRSIC